MGFRLKIIVSLLYKYLKLLRSKNMNFIYHANYIVSCPTEILTFFKMLFYTEKKYNMTTIEITILKIESIY